MTSRQKIKAFHILCGKKLIYMKMGEKVHGVLNSWLWGKDEVNLSYLEVMVVHLLGGWVGGDMEKAVKNLCIPMADSC